MIEWIAFDGDDTLWQNEVYYQRAQHALTRILGATAAAEEVHQALYATEMRNLPLYGYGIKSFTLSMVETAIKLTGGTVPGKTVWVIMELGRAMLRADLDLMDGAQETVDCLAQRYRLMLVTKGDLLDQQRKLDRSGLGAYFAAVEVVSDKTAGTYRRLVEQYGTSPPALVMVGNSLRSDVLPVLEMGANAVYVPHDLTWDHERVDNTDPHRDGYYEIEALRDLPALLERLDRPD